MTRTKPAREERVFQLQGLEIRANDDGPIISGHAAVFNQLSEPMFGFRERIMPGAFKKTLKEADVRALFNHDANFVLGRNRAKTLTLAEDLEGLAVQIQPPATTWAQDLLVTMQRGDVDQMSFGFRAIKDKWLTEDDNTQIRELHEVQLFDVSVVTFPAYPQTDAAVRAVLAESGIDWDALNSLLVRHERGLQMQPADCDLLRSTIDVLQRMLPVEPAPSGHSAEPAGSEPGIAHSPDLLRRLKLRAYELGVTV